MFSCLIRKEINYIFNYFMIGIDFNKIFCCFCMIVGFGFFWIFILNFKMLKESLKDKFEGNEFDLSFNNLDIVFVKDLVCLFKIVKFICKIYCIVLFKCVDYWYYM